MSESAAAPGAREEAEAGARRAQMSAFVTLARRHVADAGLVVPPETPTEVRPAVAGDGHEHRAVDEWYDEISDAEDPPSSAYHESELPLDLPTEDVGLVLPTEDVPLVLPTDDVGIAWLDGVSGLVAAAVFEIATGRVLASRVADRGLRGDVVASSMAWVMRVLGVAVEMMGGDEAFGPRQGFELYAQSGRIIVNHLGPDVGLAIVVDQDDVAATNASLVLALKRALPELDTRFVVG